MKNEKNPVGAKATINLDGLSITVHKGQGELLPVTYSLKMSVRVMDNIKH